MHQLAALCRRLPGTVLAPFLVLVALTLPGVAVAADPAVAGTPAATAGWGVDPHPPPGDATVHTGRGVAGSSHVGGPPAVVPEPPVLAAPAHGAGAAAPHPDPRRLSDTSTRQERGPPAAIG